MKWLRSTGYLRENERTLSFFSRLYDSFLVMLTGWLAYWIYLGDKTLPDTYKVALLIGFLLSAILFPRFHLYRTWRGSTLADELGLVTLAWFTLFACLMITSFLLKVGTDFSRGWALLWLGTGGIFHISSRIILRPLMGWARSRGFNLRRILVIGRSPMARSVADRIEALPQSGLQIVATLVDTPTFADAAITGSQGPNLESGGLADYVRRKSIDQVWLAFPLRDEERLHDVLHQLRHSTVDIRMVPDLFGFHLLNHGAWEIAGLPVIDLSVTPMGGLNRWVKAVEDRVLSLLLLLTASPIFLSIAVGVKLSSPGPIFYRQTRVGWNEETFELLKFRSMRIEPEQGDMKWGCASQKPITRFGGLLRRFSLDELPQLINVLKGEMSIVGPRPERPMFVERFKEEIPGYMKKHLVKAGITGWAQIHGLRGDTDLKQRLEFDLYYIENWSLWLDLKIIAMTPLRGLVYKGM